MNIKGYKFILFVSLLFVSDIICLQEKPFVIVIPSYNNSKWYKNNLDSVLFQNYQNYKIIYIDDCSSDNTGNLVFNYVRQKNKLDRFIFIKNNQRRGASANRYNAIHLCADEEIVVLVDGDDWLADKNVLGFLNEVYAKGDIWTTYGQFFYLSNNNKSAVKDFPQGVEFRKYKWTSKHLRTFYAGLFKKIKLKDFLHKGIFFQVASDLAESFPILEMSRGHIKCIDKGLYVYNDKNVSNDFKVHPGAQLVCEKIIRSRPAYKIETNLISYKDLSNEFAEIIIFSHSLNNLYKLLASLQKYVTNIPHIKVCCLSNLALEKEEYIKTCNYFCCDICFLENRDVKSILNNFANSTHANYIIIADDNLELRAELNIQASIKLLESTGALLFDYIHCKEDKSWYENLFFEQILDDLNLFNDPIFVCQPKYGVYNINGTYGMMYLLRKQDLSSVLNEVSIEGTSNFVKLIFDFFKLKFDFDEVMLVFGNNKYIRN